MNDKVTELYKLINESKDFSGVFKSEDEIRSLINDTNKVQDFYSILNESEDFKGVFKDVNEFTNTFSEKKKEQTIPNLLEGVLQGQKHLSEVGNKVVETPSGEYGTQPQQSPLTEEQPKEQTTPFGDVLRSLKSGSLRALGGVTASPSFLNRTLTGFAVRPMVKAMGGTDEDANLALDVIINTTPYGGATIGGAEVQKKLNKKAQQVEEKMRAIEGTIWDNIQQGKLADAGELLGRGFMQSLPYLAMTAATAGGGNVAVLSTLGATSASQQYAELEGKKESKRLLNSWLYGGFEAAGELVTAGLTRGIARAFKGTGKPPDPNFIKGLAKEVAKGFGLEGSSEAMTQIGQNITDVVTGVDEKRNILEGVLDALLIGGVTGAGLGALNPTASVVGRTLASDKETKQVQDNVVQQETLINQIKQTDSDPVKNALKRSVKDLQVQVDEVTDKNYQVAQKMSPEQQNQVAELYSVWNQLQDKIDNNEITEAEKPAIENTIKGIKDQIQTIKDDLIKAEEERVKAEKEAKVEATKEELKNELDKIAEQEKKALDKVKDVKEGEKVNKKELESVKKDFEEKKEQAKDKSDSELTKIEEESKDAEEGGITDQAVSKEGGTETGVREVESIPVRDVSDDTQKAGGEEVNVTDVDLLGDKKVQWMQEITDSEQKAFRKGYPINQISVIEGALQQKTIKGKKQPSKIKRAIQEGRITAKDAVKIIESAFITPPKEISDLAEKENQPTPPKVQETLPKTEQEGEVEQPPLKSKPISTKEEITQTTKDKEQKAIELSNDPKKLEKRLRESISVMKGTEEKKQTNWTFDNENKRLVYKDGKTTLQWQTRNNPTKPEGYDNQQTTLGTTVIKEITPTIDQKIEQAKGKVADDLDELMGAIGAIKEFTGEQRAKVLDILTRLIKDLAELTNLKGQQLYERLKEELKGRNIPEDVLQEAWDKSGFAEKVEEAPPEVKQEPKETLKQESDSGVPTGEKVAEKAPTKRKEPKEREKAYLNRVFKAEAPTDRLKALIEKKGLNYKQIPNHVSKEEADFLISQKGIEKMWDDVRDLNNGMPGAVRASILARLTFHYDQLGQEAEKEGNLAEAEMYYDKALAVVVFTDLDARDAGRFTQYLGSDEVTMMLSPKRNVERVKRALRKQRDDKMADRKDEIEDKSKKLRKANEESIDEVVKSKKIKEVVDKIVKKEKTEPSKRRVPQERIKAEQDFRKKQYEILANAWKAKRDAEKSGSMGFSATAYDEVIADTLGKIFRSYVKQGYYNVEDILIKVQKEFKKLVGEEVDTKTLRKYIPKDIDGKSFDDSLEENLLDNAKDKLAGRIVKMLEDKKVPKNDPIKQMIDTLFGKVKEGDTKEKEKKEGKPAIDKIKEALDNKEEYAEVWEKAKEEVQTRIDYNNELSEEQKAEYTKRLDAFYKEIIGKPYNQKQIEQITRQAIEDLGFAMDRIIREHYTIQDVISISLQDKLVEELGLTGEDAKLLTEAVDKEFRKIATARKLSVLRRGMKPRDVNNPKQSRQEWQRLIELTNMGAFSDAEFAEAYADAWGFPKLTPEQAKELERLAGKVYEIKTGFKQYEAVQDYLNYIARIPGVDMGEVIMGVWYANILSGARTQSKNFLGNTANFLAEWSVSVVKAAATGKFDVIPFVTIGAGRGLKQGLYDFWYTMTTGYSPIRGGKIEAATTLERWRFKGWKYPLNAFKYVGRFMIATDTLFYSGLKEFRAYEMAMMEARKSDPEATEPSQSNWAKANEILHNTTERRIEAESQATEEGLKGIEWKKRVWEIMEESRGETIVHGSADFASRGTYNYKPEGMLGAATAMIARLADWATIRPTLFGKQYSIRLGKVVVPFTRIIANVGNTAMDYTPIGYIRAAQGSMGLEYFKNEDQAKSFYRKLTSEERWRIFTKASLGLAAYTLLLAKSAPGDDDEEPELTITADGFGDFAKNEELKKQPEGWQQYSVKIKGKWYSYQYTPLFLVLAPLGWLRDGQKYKKDKFDEKSTLDLIGGSMFRTMAAMADMTWMTTVAGFLESFTTGTPEGYFKRLGTSTVKGLIYPKFVEQFKQYYDEWNDNPKKYSSSFWGKILKDTPLLTNKFPVQYNNFGEPVIFDPVQMIESGTSDPYAKYIAENLYQHGKVLGVPSQKETACTIYDEDKKIERQMDDFEYMDYVREIGLRTKDRIMTELMPKDLTWEEIGKEVESIKQEVRQLVKAEMFGWGEFRMANPLKWKTLYNNRAVQIPETTPVKWKDEDGKQMKATKEEMVQFNKDAMNIYTEYMLEYLAGKPDKKEINPATGEFIYIEYIKTLWSGSKEAAKAQLIENREISPK